MSPKKYGYWVDLAHIQLGDQSWVHALPIGEYEHPVYGTMKFDAARIARFADSVNTKVRGIDLDIDYDHKDQSGKAAGWVRAADARPDGLYVQIDWTSPAAEALRNKEYRYFSPEFDDEWTDASGTVHKDVLFGGALTNRPFLKNLLPVNLSEITEPEQKGGQMDPKLIRQLLGLGEDADDAAVQAKITELMKPAPTPPESPKPEPTPTPEPVGAAALSEAIAKALAESPMAKELAELKKGLETSESARRLAETRDRLAGIMATQNGRKYVLPPSVVNAVAEGMTLSDPAAMGNKFVDALAAFAQTGMVELGERGRMNQGSQEVSPQDELMKAVSTLRTKHLSETGKELPVTDAIRMVCSSQPGLYLAYREASYSGREE